MLVEEKRMKTYTVMLQCGFSSTNSFEGLVQDKAVRSPFGPIAAPRMREGSQVEVLMRPEALQITPAQGKPLPEGAAQAHILTVRTLRRASFLHLCLGDFAGNHLHFHCRIPGRQNPKVGETVHVTLDRAQAFVFPVDSNSKRFVASAIGCPPDQANDR